MNKKILYKLSQPHGDNMVYIGDAALKMHILKQTAWRCVPCVSKVFETKLPSLRGEIDCMGVYWWRSAQYAHFETDGVALCAVCFKSLRDEAPVASWRNGLYGVYWYTMDMLWEKFQLILPLYTKPISFQSNASVVCSVTTAVFIDFCLKKQNVFSQYIGKKNKWISEFHRTNPQELKCWSTFYVNYFPTNYLMMQHQPIVKRVNGTHEWAHRSYEPLSAPYHCCLYKHRRLDERQPPQTSRPVPICT